MFGIGMIRLFLSLLIIKSLIDGVPRNSSNARDDNWALKCNIDGRFTLKSAYICLPFKMITGS